ncbi:MAG: D-alanine--D-alanine ligase [Solimonas sp.]
MRRTSNPQDFGRVAVLAGGWSSERQVALWSGEGIHKALREKGVDATLIDATPGRVLDLKREGFDRVFNILHGTGGEDGTVQAVLGLQGIPYTGSGVLASALAMDKLRTKRIWKAEGLPTPDWLLLRDNDDALAAGARLGYPYFVKPAAEGSSVGISKVKYATSAVSAFRKASGAYEQDAKPVLAERYVEGGEYTCAILGEEALPLVRIEPDGEFYDYHAKYISDNTRYHCPAGLPEAQERALQALCLEAFRLLGARGWGRVDFLLDAQQRPWLLEANLVPGMTSHSLVPMAAKARGVDYASLCWAILEDTLAGAQEGGG